MDCKETRDQYCVYQHTFFVAHRSWNYTFVHHDMRTFAVPVQEVHNIDSAEIIHPTQIIKKQFLARQ